MVPRILEDTVNPCQPELKCQIFSSVCSAPEITTVSKPKRNPPRAAIRAILTG
jgi:hypothetical protein